MKINEVKSMIEHVGKSIECDHDWVQTLIMEHKGECTVVGIPVPMENQIDRDICAFIIKKMLKEADADGAVWITTAWSVRLINVSKAEEKAALEQAAEHKLYERSDKVECVVAVIANRDGKDDGNTVITGRIIRSAEHPKVDWDWMNLPADTESAFMGTFPEAVSEGVKA